MSSLSASSQPGNLGAESGSSSIDCNLLLNIIALIRTIVPFRGKSVTFVVVIVVVVVATFNVKVGQLTVLVDLLLQ